MESIVTTIITYLTADWLRTYIYCGVLYSILCVSDIVKTPWSTYNLAKLEDKRNKTNTSEWVYTIFTVYIPSVIWSIVWPVGLIKRIIRRTRYTLYLLGVYLFKQPRNIKKELLKWPIGNIDVTLGDEKKG